jgi:Spx/MgsR family transcriptional regulator
MIKIYGIKNCDSVKKAIKYFKAHDLAYTFIDFKQTKIEEETIALWLKKVEIDKLFNTRGTTYRTLKLKELALDDTLKQMWLAKENMLIKRPVVTYKDTLLVAFDEAIYDSVFKV